MKEIKANLTELAKQMPTISADLQWIFPLLHEKN